MSRHHDTIAAPATPAGTSALAIVRISGTDTARLARGLLGELPAPRMARHADYHTTNGALVDDVVFTWYQAPHSYTGEDALEISCHGNPFIVQKIVEDLLTRGCRLADPGEFTQRAFLNGRMDLSQAEAVMDVIHARSERALAAAQRQLRGGLSRRMNAAIDLLVDVLARIEAYIDFPEEDLPAEDRTAVLHDIASISLNINGLIATTRYGALLRDGVRTVIVGAANAGKSSLLNRLVGRDRALVSPEPGTTRDFIEERIVAGEHCLRLIDTAGLNPSPTPLEALGIAKTWECVNEADLLLLVIDGSAPSPLPSASAAFAPPISNHTLVVLNKADLAPNAAPLLGFPQEDQIRVSALTGGGLAELHAAIAAKIETFNVASEDLVAINARHAQALTQARELLESARAKLTSAEPIELIASELRGALAALGEIVGRIDNERVLDRLFATFCIGK